MITVLVLLAILGWGIALRRRCHWAPEVIPIALSASIIVALFFFGLVLSVRVGAWVLIGGGLLAGLSEWRATGWRRPQMPGGWRPAIVIFAVMTAAAVLRLQGAALWTNDEFSHWGLNAKIIILTGELIPKDSAASLPDYPPGSALFYYFLTFGHEYSEYLLYAAHAALAFAAVPAVCVGSGWLASAAAFALAYFGLFAFAGGLQILGVDVILSLFFGGAIAGYFRDNSPHRSWLIPVLLALPLLKSIGLLLALFAVLVIACDQFFADTPVRRRVAFVLVLAAAPLLMHAVWAARMRVLEIPPTFQVPVSLEAVSNVYDTPRGELTRGRFRTALTATPVNQPWADTLEERMGQQKAGRPTPPLSVAVCTWLFALLAAVAAAAQRDGTQQRRVIVASVVLLASVGVYGAVLLLLYVNSFTEYEGTRLMSFGRYFGIMFLGLTQVLLAWLLAASRTVMVTSLVMAGLGFLALPDGWNFLKDGPHRMSEGRRQIQELLRTVNASPPDKSVYFVWQGTHGLELRQSRYELAPRHSNTACWSIGTPEEGDVWTCRKSLTDWAEDLRQYDYLLLGRADTGFWQTFGGLFAGRLNSRTFVVAKDSASNRLRLTAAVEVAEAEARAARDRQRVANLQLLQQALESYITRHGPLPSPAEYGEAAVAPDFWDRWWDLSAVDGNGNGRPFLDFLVERGVVQSIPVDPVNVTSQPTNPREGQQFVYYMVPPSYDYAGGPCGAPNRGHYLLAITDLESEVSRPPKTISSPGCACLWRNDQDFFQKHFDYVLCGSFDPTPRAQQPQ